ncbi:uncharacterized protein LOC124542441 [Vanessa cardui]|uniref:uncharacterized protein LOC124542441 n=1 Tax=Vanessa cardui TaxID=171605 RepID=UPI001F131AEA|nr:uncharacterized protein LOC124542441 [Vanessa cardui]
MQAPDETRILPVTSTNSTRRSLICSKSELTTSVSSTAGNDGMRRKRRVTFRLTQVLTGHGCFGEYLCRIGREATAVCHHCGADQNDAHHTLEACPGWTAERQVLVQQIGRNLSLRAVVSAMLRRESAWEAVVNFCETFMVQKETAGRARERADSARQRRPAGRLHGLQAPVPGAE